MTFTVNIPCRWHNTDPATMIATVDTSTQTWTARFDDLNGFPYLTLHGDYALLPGGEVEFTDRSQDGTPRTARGKIGAGTLEFTAWGFQVDLAPGVHRATKVAA